MDGEISAGQTTFSAHIQRMLPPGTLLPSANTSALERQWDHLCALELIGAYLNFYEATLAQRTQCLTESSFPVTSSHPHPRDLFQPRTVAFDTMASTQQAVLRPIVPLLLLHIFLFNHRHSSTHELAYQYWALRKKFEPCDIDLRSGPSYLVYAIGLTPDLKRWEDNESMFLLARMLSVETRLSEATRAELKASLLRLLSLDADRGLTVTAEMDDERLRVERVQAAMSRELLGSQIEEFAQLRR